ncbi:MAG: hypothetical protein AAGA96_05200 [Verrucomicrobiota bacterium]
MNNHSKGEEPLQELKHEAVPGYAKAFAIAFAIMGLYLAVILFSSPGPAEYKSHDKASDDHGAEKKDSPEDEKQHDGTESKPH